MQPCGTFSESYAEDKALFRTKTHWALFAILLLGLIPFGMFASPILLSLAITILITIIAVHGLNILTGYCGQVSIAQAAFMGVGAYTCAILCSYCGFSFWAALPCAAIASGLVGILFGLPSFRLKEFYLLMATIAAQFIIIWLIIQLRSWTGGTDGMMVSSPELGGVVIKDKHQWFFLSLASAALMTFFAYNLMRSKIGRAFIAIRDNDLAAQVMGISVWKYKLLAFFIGSTFAGVAGALWAAYFRGIHPDHFGIWTSVWMLGMLIVGGMGSTMGVIYGTILIKGLEEFVTVIAPWLAAAFPFIAAQVAASIGLALNGLVIALFLILEPRGINHRWVMAKSWYRLWPFSYWR